MKVRGLFIDKERVWHPDQLNVLSPHHQLLEAAPPLELEAGVTPKLAEVHVQGEVLMFVTASPWGGVRIFYAAAVVAAAAIAVDAQLAGVFGIVVAASVSRRETARNWEVSWRRRRRRGESARSKEFGYRFDKEIGKEKKERKWLDQKNE